MAVDLTELNHAPMPGRAPGVHRAVAGALKARIETLEAELGRLEAAAAVHRADFERERERCERADSPFATGSQSPRASH
jgi:hypothetical protein